jgi:aspartate 1-decarboxylase
VICLNGAAARRAVVGDHLIICAYSEYTEEELLGHTPIVVVVDERNRAARRLTPGTSL